MRFGRRTSHLLAVSGAVSLLVGCLAAAPGSTPGVPAVHPHQIVDVPSAALAPAASTDRGAHGGATVHPAAPQLGDNGLSPAAISLNWSQSTSLLFSNYSIYRSVSATGPWTLVAVITSASSVGATFDALAPGTTYYWEVTENDALGSSTSNTLGATQPSTAYLTSPSSSTTSIVLNWTNNATYGGGIAFVQYSIVETPGGGSSRVAAVSYNSSNVSMNVTGLVPGGNYSFYLATEDCVAGCGGSSPTLSNSFSNTVVTNTKTTPSAVLVAPRTLVDVGQPVPLACTPSGGTPPYTFGWNFSGGTSFAAGNESESPVFFATGPSVVNCRIADHAGNLATASVTIDANPYPSINITVNRTAADIGELVSFNCTASPGTAPLTTGWTFGDGGSLAGVGPDANGSYAYRSVGTYVAECEVADGVGATAAVSVAVNVSLDPSAKISANSLAAAPGSTILLKGEALNGSGGFGGFRWTFGDKTKSVTTQNTSHAFSAPGNYTVTFHFNDSNNESATARATVRVSSILIDVSPTVAQATVGRPVAFAASATGGAGAPYNFTWDFGDGTVGYGQYVNHTYSTTGSFAPTVTVTDRLRAVSQASLPYLPVASVPSAYAWFTAGVLLTLSAALGVAVAVGYALLRRRESAMVVPAALSGWVPPTGPRAALVDSKLCPSCGAANLPTRGICRACGATLPKGPA